LELNVELGYIRAGAKKNRCLADQISRELYPKGFPYAREDP